MKQKSIQIIQFITVHQMRQRNLLAVPTLVPENVSACHISNENI